MIKSIIELTDLIQKYKQEIFWESEKLKKKFNAFYKNQPIESLEKLKDYKIFGYVDLNIFLYNRLSENTIVGASGQEKNRRCIWKMKMFLRHFFRELSTQ